MPTSNDQQRAFELVSDVRARHQRNGHTSVCISCMNVYWPCQTLLQAEQLYLLNEIAVHLDVAGELQALQARSK